MKFLPSPLNVNYTVLQRWVRTKVFCQIGEETKQIFWSISTQQGFATVVKPLVNTSPDRCTMYISLGLSNSELGCRSMLKFTLLEVGISFAASCPTMTSCSSASSRPLVTSSASSASLVMWPQSTQLLFQASAVPLARKTNRVLFCLSTGKKGVGARTGRVVASKCDPYYVWGALVPVRLARISTIQECMQTLGKMWTPGTW